mmetsp:Transcript_104219/g.271381  ORF Transcript_104219/g.271381 Transcript_104219/m.271381 type:complete len:112 (-) Transcript_104219:315-650(-)
MQQCSGSVAGGFSGGFKGSSTCCPGYDCTANKFFSGYSECLPAGGGFPGGPPVASEALVARDPAEFVGHDWAGICSLLVLLGACGALIAGLIAEMLKPVGSHLDVPLLVDV